MDFVDQCIKGKDETTEVRTLIFLLFTNYF